MQITSCTKPTSYYLSDGLCNFSHEFRFLHYQITTLYSASSFALAVMGERGLRRR